jgi:hypothetical protein
VTPQMIREKYEQNFNIINLTDLNKNRMILPPIKRKNRNEEPQYPKYRYGSEIPDEYRS